MDNVAGIITRGILETCIEFVPCQHFSHVNNPCTVARVREDVPLAWLEACASRILENGELAHVRGCTTNVGFAHAYAEPGYDQPEKAILFADWNNAQERAPEPLYWTDVDRINEMAAELFERVGYAIEWEDEWSTCDECGKAVRTSPDSYVFEPSYVLIAGGCELLCKECAPIDTDTDTDTDE